MSKAQELSEAFEAVLRDHLGAENFRKVQELNRKCKSEKHCHSHDFIDANMAMLEAYKQVLGREPLSPCDEPEPSEAALKADADLWNEAWNLFFKRCKENEQ